ncbi:hypothetical protein LXD69_13870 [Flavobacterium sediminilitoris]|uniref:Uncharacterized protein n=1 Tax=Flavobacterium sediminilitoris TaxID=2024526 RepID=A0ABY4HLE3_9FLAO|nr:MULTISPECIES: hypothetical protein [Flavobacterium]UOX33121.1 hypothetical protein LXD69_13870 [Flavobacterium sediminilitoris]
MGKQKLQEKSINKAFLDILKIDFLDIMPDERFQPRHIRLENKNIKNMKYNFSINAESFINKIIDSYKSLDVKIKNITNYFKIHFIEDDNKKLSICFSISSLENMEIGEEDIFFKIDGNDELEKLEKDNNGEIPYFKKRRQGFQDNLLKDINLNTKINGQEMENTEVISFKLKDVYLFIISHFLLENDYSKLYFQMIIFEEEFSEKKYRNKLSCVVRAKNNYQKQGEAFDFGTIYP